MWPRSRGIDVIWANILYNIVINEWELIVFFHTNKCKCISLNVVVKLPICEETKMFFRAKFQTQTCFETARAVWLPKHLRSQKYFFSICIQLKLR